MYANNYQPPPFAEEIPDIAMPPPYEVPYGRELPDELGITPPAPPSVISAPHYQRESPVVMEYRKEKRRQEKAHASRKTYRTIPPAEDDDSTIGCVLSASWRSTKTGVPIAKAYVPHSFNRSDQSQKSYHTDASQSSHKSDNSKKSLNTYQRHIGTAFDPIDTWKPKKNGSITSSKSSFSGHRSVSSGQDRRN